LFNFFIGKEIGKDDPGIKMNVWLITGLIINMGILIVFKYFQRNKEHALQIEKMSSDILRWSICIAMIILLFGGRAQKFIYFLF